MNRSSAIEALVAVACLGACAGAAAQPRVPSEIVAAAATELATTVETRRTELEGDALAVYELVDRLILPRFDMRRGSRAILAQHWQSMSDAERARFVEGFYNYLVATYGALLVQFKPDTLRVLPLDDAAGGSPVRVKTVLKMNDGTEVDVDFVMAAGEGEWKIVDVVAEGVSYVKTYRSQFGVDIAIDGLPSVLDWLERKAAPRFARVTR